MVDCPDVIVAAPDVKLVIVGGVLAAAPISMDVTVEKILLLLAELVFTPVR